MGTEPAKEFLAKLEDGPLDGLAFTVKDPDPLIELPVPCGSPMTESIEPGVGSSQPRVATYRLVTDDDQPSSSLSAHVLRYVYLRLRLDSPPD